jgi:hypothetical protein
LGYNSGPRVPLACIQCRTRHVRCDAVNPTCSRCQKEGKCCSYTKSRRGGRCRASPSQGRAAAPRSEVVQASNQVQSGDATLVIYDLNIDHAWNLEESMSTSFGLSDDPGYVSESAATTDQMLALYYTCFHNAHPCALPHRFMRQRMNENPESVQLLVLVMSFIGSLYAPSVASKPI